MTHIMSLNFKILLCTLEAKTPFYQVHSTLTFAYGWISPSFFNLTRCVLDRHANTRSTDKMIMRSTLMNFYSKAQLSFSIAFMTTKEAGPTFFNLIKKKIGACLFSSF